MSSQESEATVFFIDDIIHEIKQLIEKAPTKPVMHACMVSWLNTLETIKSLNEK